MNAGRWTGFRRVVGRVNAVTGEVIDLVPGILLHGEDADWWFDSWSVVDEIEYKVGLAVAESEAQNARA